MLSKISKLAVPLAFLLIIGCFCLFYWSRTYQELAIWYKQINPFFYNSQIWGTELFTPTVKMSGNRWCAIGLFSALLISWQLWKLKLPQLVWHKPSRHSILEYAIIFIAGIAIALSANWGTLYTSDEVFSALNFASLPLFQTISNYPKPNNHLFFNALNGMLFFWSDDLVFTGRLISLIFYSLTLCITWRFLKKWELGHWLSGLILLALAVQFPALGFAWQARGYEMVLFFSILSFASLASYLSENKSHQLALHTLCNIAGIFTLPSYLYWWTGLGLAAILYQFFLQKLDLKYIKATVVAIAIGLVLYLPLLCFSGIAALTENKYVASEAATRWHFFTHLNERHYFEGLFSEWFCTPLNSILPGLAMLTIPLILFLNKAKKPATSAALTTIYSILIAFLGMTLYLLRLPYYRNLLAHGYLFLLLALLSVAMNMSAAIWRRVYGMVLLSITLYSLKTNLPRLPDNLYYYPVRHEYEKNQRIKSDIDASKPIYLEYEDFYWWYVLRKRYAGQPLQVLPNRSRDDFENTSSDKGPFQVLQ